MVNLVVHGEFATLNNSATSRRLLLLATHGASASLNNLAAAPAVRRWFQTAGARDGRILGSPSRAQADRPHRDSQTSRCAIAGCYFGRCDGDVTDAPQSVSMGGTRSSCQPQTVPGSTPARMDVPKMHPKQRRQLCSRCEAHFFQLFGRDPNRTVQGNACTCKQCGKQISLISTGFCQEATRMN